MSGRLADAIRRGAIRLPPWWIGTGDEQLALDSARHLHHALPGAERLLADDVFRYYDAAFTGEFDSPLIKAPSLLPPYASLWVEGLMGATSRTPRVVGVHFETAEWTPEDSLTHPVLAGLAALHPKWIVSASGYWMESGDQPVGPVGFNFLALDAMGRLLPGGQVGIVPDTSRTAVSDIDPTQLSRTLGSEVFMPAMFAVSLMHCKNVHVAPLPISATLLRQQARKGKPMLTFSELDVRPMREAYQRLRSAGAHGLSTSGLALHLMRGHFKTFTPDNPLFGKRVGAFWWDPIVRGHAANGVRVKDYRMHAPPTPSAPDAVRVSALPAAADPSAVTPPRADDIVTP